MYHSWDEKSHTLSAIFNREFTVFFTLLDNWQLTVTLLNISFWDIKTVLFISDRTTSNTPCWGKTNSNTPFWSTDPKTSFWGRTDPNTQLLGTSFWGRTMSWGRTDPNSGARQGLKHPKGQSYCLGRQQLKWNQENQEAHLVEDSQSTVQFWMIRQSHVTADLRWHQQ